VRAAGCGPEHLEPGVVEDEEVVRADAEHEVDAQHVELGQRGTAQKRLMNGSETAQKS
jgi:hypothetical protein